MQQSSINELLKAAQDHKREELILLFMSTSADYMNERHSNMETESKKSEELYLKVRMAAVLIEMKETIKEIGIQGIQKKFRDAEFTRNLFDTKLN